MRPTEKDPLALWFDIVEEVGGGFSTARIGRAAGSEPPVWEDFPHARWDGVSAFTHLFAKHEGYAAPIPKLRRDDATRLDRLRALVRWSRVPHPPRVAFKRFDASRGGRPSALSWVTLSRAETAHV